LQVFFKTYAGLARKPAPASNHCNGGIRPTSTEVQTPPTEDMPNFSRSVSAPVRLHGFNRLGTNSLLELLVMGRSVGERVLSHLTEKQVPAPKGAGEATLEQFSNYLEAQGRENVGMIRQEMRELMTRKVGVFRIEKGMQEAIASLTAFKQRAAEAGISTKSLKMNQELLERWELDNILDNAMTITQGALMRTESRGAHFREDYPERSDAFQFHTLVSMTEFGKVSFGKRPIDMSVYESKGEYYEQFRVMPRKY
jgi:succinate dehydrogenase / fumarate reductase flavoprotein subunit